MASARHYFKNTHAKNLLGTPGKGATIFAQLKARNLIASPAMEFFFYDFQE